MEIKHYDHSKTNENIFKCIWRTIRAKNKVIEQNPQILDSTAKTAWNLYNPNEPVGEHFKRFNWVHFFFKYKIIVPFLLLIERITYKYIQKDVPPQIYNTNLQIFNDSFEKSIDDWGWLYLRNTITAFRGMTQEQMKEQMKDHYGARCLRIAKNSTITVALIDTAYREFTNIWVFNMMQEYNKHYAGKQHINHLFFTNPNSADLNYYFLYPHVTEHVSVFNAKHNFQDNINDLNIKQQQQQERMQQARATQGEQQIKVTMPNPNQPKQNVEITEQV